MKRTAMAHDYDDSMPPISVRLPRDMLAKVDALVERCNTTEYGRSSRSTMLLALVTMGLRDLERRGS